MKLQTPRGTRDFLPEEMAIRQKVIDIIRKNFEIFGFQPMGTPAIEEWEVLSAKGAGGDEILKETYNFEDLGGRRIGLRYDLTVPLARFVASNPNLLLPFKRYQIDRVWRYGDVAKGRLREFLQADIDIIGSQSMLADAEIIACTIKTFEDLGFKEFFVRLNDRKILSGLMQYAGIEKNTIVEALRAVDKLEKIGEDAVKRELEKVGVSPTSSEKLLKFINKIGEDALESAERIMKNIKEGMDGVAELKELMAYLEKMGLKDRVRVDFSLARGLDYYTGPIFEVSAGKGVGSIAGGGRYDKMIGLFSKKDVPATGISFGVERIIEIVKERKMLITDENMTKLFVANVDEKARGEAMKISQMLRESGIPTQNDLMGWKLTRQLEYCNSVKIPYVIVVGEREIKSKEVSVKDMKNKTEKRVKVSDIVEYASNLFSKKVDQKQSNTS